MTQRVIFQPNAYEGLRAGINMMVDAVRPTLGPRPRVVALAPIVGSRMPELLDDGGTIMRRIVQLPDKDQDMGAMYVRQLLWNLHENVGDGTATAAVLFQSIYNQGLRYITAGGSPMQLRGYLENGLKVIHSELSGMITPVEGEEALVQVAEAICYDRPLSEMLGEIFNIIGEYGHLDVRTGNRRQMEREYVEGMYWRGNIWSRRMINNPSELKAQLDDAHVLISDLFIEDPRALVPVIAMAMKAKVSGLMILARKLSDDVIGLLMANSKPGKFQVIAAKTPGATTTDVRANLVDVAVLTGGQPFVRAAGDSLRNVTLDSLGQARRVWADRFHFGVVGGKGDPGTLRRHIADLRQAFQASDDPETRKALRERIGKLMGGSATLWVGGVSELDMKARKELADRTADAMRGAVREGVLPGGGVSLLACRPALRKLLEESTNADEQAAYRILIRALEEPTRTIISNSGGDASEVMAEIKHAGPGHGFDVVSEQVTNMAEAGVFDSAAAQKGALRGAIKSAALALTVDVLIHRKKPPESVNP